MVEHHPISRETAGETTTTTTTTTPIQNGKKTPSSPDGKKSRVIEIVVVEQPFLHQQFLTTQNTSESKFEDDNDDDVDQRDCIGSDRADDSSSSSNSSSGTPSNNGMKVDGPMHVSTSSTSTTRSPSFLPVIHEDKVLPSRLANISTTTMVGSIEVETFQDGGGGKIIDRIVCVPSSSTVSSYAATEGKAHGPSSICKRVVVATTANDNEDIQWVLAPSDLGNDSDDILLNGDVDQYHQNTQDGVEISPTLLESLLNRCGCEPFASPNSSQDPAPVKGVLRTASSSRLGRAHNENSSKGKVGVSSPPPSRVSSPTFSVGSPTTKSVSSASSAGSSSSTSSYSIPARVVSFGGLEIREFSMTLGDHPSAVSGPPVQLDWDTQPSVHKVIQVDEYERMRSPRRKRNQLKLSYKARRGILEDDKGFSTRDIHAAWAEALKIRKQRQETLKRGLLLMMWDDMWESAQRKCRRVLDSVGL